MLNVPTINNLMDKVDSKYTLVIVASKRARHVIDHNPDMLTSGAVNPVTLALNDVVDGKLHWDNGQGLNSDHPHEAFPEKPGR